MKLSQHKIIHQHVSLTVIAEDKCACVHLCVCEVRMKASLAANQKWQAKAKEQEQEKKSLISFCQHQ